MFKLEEIVRSNILNLKPYSSARDEYTGADAIFLDANENPFQSGLNRYPDPLQQKLKAKISQIKNVHWEQIFLGNGSDEPIDLVFRAFCEPGKDNVIAMKPTYGMYKVCADINQIEYREASLDRNYQLDITALLEKADENSKLLFLCSPNNPTSNSLAKADITLLLESFDGIVILDEAYIDFSDQPSFLKKLNDFPNLIVLQTFSKAWGMAGIRLGMAFASKSIIRVLNHIKYPYNVNVLTQQTALRQLQKDYEVKEMVKQILSERNRLHLELENRELVLEVLPSDANFLMVKLEKPKEIYHYLVGEGIIVRDRSNVALCDGFLRLTIGTTAENQALLDALDKYSEKCSKNA